MILALEFTGIIDIAYLLVKSALTSTNNHDHVFVNAATAFEPCARHGVGGSKRHSVGFGACSLGRIAPKRSQLAFKSFLMGISDSAYAYKSSWRRRFQPQSVSSIEEQMLAPTQGQSRPFRALRCAVQIHFSSRE